MLSIMAILRPNLSETLPIKNCHTNPPHIALNIKNDTLLTSNPNDKPNTDAIAKNPLTAIRLQNFQQLPKVLWKIFLVWRLVFFLGLMALYPQEIEW